MVAGIALVEELDKKLLVQLRDGRKIVGYLRSAMSLRLPSIVGEGCAVATVARHCHFWVEWMVLMCTHTPRHAAILTKCLQASAMVAWKCPSSGKLAVSVVSVFDPGLDLSPLVDCAHT